MKLLAVSSGVLLTRAAAAAATYLVTIFVGRLYGVAATGQYFLIVVLMTVVTVLGSIGQDTTILRDIGGLSGPPRRTARTVISRGLALAGFVSALLAASAVLLWPLFEAVFALESRSFFTVMVVSAPFTALLGVACAVIRAQRRAIIAEALQRLFPPVLLGGLLLGLVAIGYERSLFELGSAHLASRLVPAIASIVAVVWVSGRLIRPSSSHLMIAARSGRPFLALEILFLASGWTDTLMLGWLESSTAVGAYGAATRSAGLILWPLLALTSVLGPLIAEAFQNHDATRLRSLSRAGSGILALFALPALILLVMSSQWILGLFGSGFQIATTSLRLLVVGLFVNLLTGPVAILLKMTGNEGSLIRNMALMTLLNAALNGLLIPSYGINGAAAATAITTAGVNVLNATTVRRRLGFWIVPSFRNLRDARRQGVD